MVFAPRSGRAPTFRRTQLLFLGLATLVVLGMLPGSVGSSLSWSHTPVPSARSPAAVSPTNGTPVVGCDGYFWNSSTPIQYQPGCYGHDEPTFSYMSTAPHSGEDAAW